MGFSVQTPLSISSNSTSSIATSPAQTPRTSYLLSNASNIASSRVGENPFTTSDLASLREDSALSTLSTGFIPNRARSVTINSVFNQSSTTYSVDYYILALKNIRRPDRVERRWTGESLTGGSLSHFFNVASMHTFGKPVTELMFTLSAPDAGSVFNMKEDIIQRNQEELFESMKAELLSGVKDGRKQGIRLFKILVDPLPSYLEQRRWEEGNELIMDDADVEDTIL